MTVIQRPMAGYGWQRRSSDRCRSLEDSPEAVLLSLAADIRQLSGERLFSEELLLMEHIFGLLLAGFRRQQLPDGRVALVPPQAAVAAPAGDQLLVILPPAQLGVIAALLKAGMDWVEVDGQAALLCFPTRLLAS